MKRICIWAVGLIVFFPSLSQAQTRFLNFHSRGSYFTTTPTVWFASSPGRHEIAANSSLTKGTSTYKKYPQPSYNVYNAAVSGTYIRHGILLGYEIFAGAGSRAVDRSSGATLSSRTVNAGAEFQLGLQLLQVGGLSILPYGGIGYGVFGERLQLEGTAEKAGQTEYEFDDVYVNNNSIIIDAGMKAMFRVGHRRGQNKSRFTFGGQAGFRSMQPSNRWMVNYEVLPEKAAAIGTTGFFTGLILGVGLSD